MRERMRAIPSAPPLAPAKDARVLDSSDLTIAETVQAILDFWRESGNA